MHYVTLTAAILALVSSVANAGPDEPVRYSRTGAWEVNYDRDSCHLQTRFGTDDGIQFASFTRYQPVPSGSPGVFELTLYGKRLNVSGGVRDATLDFGVGEPLRVKALTGSQGPLHVAIFRFAGYSQHKPSDEPVPDEVAYAAITGVTVKLYDKPEFHLVLGPLAKPMAALNTCTQDLVKSWGFDPAVQAALKERPTPRTSPSTWFSNSDYPEPATRLAASGLVHFRLDVEADGSVSGCYILARTEPDMFAKPTCQAMMRKATFKPAIDAAGNPVRSYFVSSMQFNIMPLPA